jgi:1-pyrroline-5-carboxylate dehydrogenase
MAPTQKVTYTSTNVDLDEFHRAFDDALARLRANLGKTYPLYLGGQAIEGSGGGAPIVDTSPIDTQLVLGTFAAAGPAQIDQAVASARAAQKAWAGKPWRERLAILRRAAVLIRDRKFDLAATMSLEVGKSRLEAMGDAEESADLIDYYAQQVEDASGFVRPMAQMTPIERNTDVMRPYGVFACIAPFNFPLALSTGMSSAALMVGNAVVYKPALDTPTRCTAMPACPPGCSTSCPDTARRWGMPCGSTPGWTGSCSPGPSRSACGSTRGSARATSSPACSSWAARTRRS